MKRQTMIVATAALALIVAALWVAAAWPRTDADFQGWPANLATAAALAGVVAVIVASACRRR
jgi:hypothetical protein